MAKVKAKADTVKYEVITQVDSETGDLLLPIPPELLERLEWQIGDDVDFSVDKKSGQVVIKKISK